MAAVRPGTASWHAGAAVAGSAINKARTESSNRITRRHIAARPRVRQPAGTPRALVLCYGMRMILLALLFPLAACGSNDEGNQTAGPPPGANVTPPTTPMMQVTPAPGNSVEWMEPVDAPGAPRNAPYDNLLDEPLVKGKSAN